MSAPPLLPLLREALAALLLVGGASVVALAALGVARLPDPFSRMHAAAKAGVGGAGLLLLGTGLAFGTAGAMLTAGAAVAFLLLTAPVASHVLGRAAYVSGAPLGAASASDALAGVLVRHAPADPATPGPTPLGPAVPGPARTTEPPATTARASSDPTQGRSS